MAFRNVFQQASPSLLEPVVKMEITVPEESVGDVYSDMSGRGGRVPGGSGTEQPSTDDGDVGGDRPAHRSAGDERGVGVADPLLQAGDVDGDLGVAEAGHREGVDRRRDAAASIGDGPRLGPLGEVVAHVVEVNGPVNLPQGGGYAMFF